jgi:serine/threonine-protein kinase
MSPEQVSGTDTLDGRSDIFSAGVVLYELLTGRKPFRGDTPTGTIVQILRQEPPPLETLVPGLPPQLVAAVTRAMAKEVADRYATAGELARDLQMIRRSLQTAEDASLDETRFASPAELAELQQQLNKDATAKGTTTTVTTVAPAGKRWAVPAAIAAIAIIGIGAFIFGGLPRASGSNAGSTGDGAALPAASVPSADAAKTVLNVETTPAGAELALDGESVSGATPARLTLTGAGPFTLRVSKRGFVTQEVQLTAADLARGSVTYTLAAAEVQRVPVSITSSYDVEVFLV